MALLSLNILQRKHYGVKLTFLKCECKVSCRLLHLSVSETAERSTVIHMVRRSTLEGRAEQTGKRRMHFFPELA